MSLPIDRIVDVNVLVSPQLPQPPSFNVGAIVGSTAVIPASERVRAYASVAAMLADGFTLNNPEVLAAQLYFEQPVPPDTVRIGRQDLTAIRSVQIHGANQGNGYVVGDELTATQVGASGGKVLVATIGAGGAVLTVTIKANEAGNAGTGYSVANGVATTTNGAGTGAQLDILAVGDTPLQSIVACRAVDPTWWGVMSTTAVKADHLLIAPFVESMQPAGYYFFTTADADVPTNGVNNIFAQLKALSYKRTFGVYSTTQSGVFPNNAYAVAAAEGTAMGLNTGLAGSAFTMKFKPQVGVAPEPLTLTQVNAIELNNGNVYVNYDNVFSMLEQGTSSNGQFLDQILGLDMMTADIQFGVFDLLISVPKNPQTDPGQTELIHAVNQALDQSVVRGFIAGGTWNGVTILNLKRGDPMPQGYITQSPPYSTQTPADKAARKSMPVYVAINLAGAVHSVLVGVYVQ